MTDSIKTTKKRNLETFEFTKARSRQLAKLKVVTGWTKKEVLYRALDLLQKNTVTVL